MRPTLPILPTFFPNRSSNISTTVSFCASPPAPQDVAVWRTVLDSSHNNTIMHSYTTAVRRRPPVLRSSSWGVVRLSLDARFREQITVILLQLFGNILGELSRCDPIRGVVVFEKNQFVSHSGRFLRLKLPGSEAGATAAPGRATNAVAACLCEFTTFCRKPTFVRKQEVTKLLRRTVLGVPGTVGRS